MATSTLSSPNDERRPSGFPLPWRSATIPAPLIQAEILANSDVNKNRVQRVEQCFGQAGQPLYIPGRALIAEGVLLKMCRKRPKRRIFFLFSDILVYGTIVKEDKKYVAQHIVNLEDMTVTPLTDDRERRNAWEIRSPTRSFVVMAQTTVEKDEWVKYIEALCDFYRSRRGDSSLQSGPESSPVWVPDYYTSVCMRCTKRFTFVVRRHHCRQCGFVVCSQCSLHKIILPYQSSLPVRVCNNCFQENSGNPSTPHPRFMSSSSMSHAIEDDDSDSDASAEEDVDRGDH